MTLTKSSQPNPSTALGAGAETLPEYDDDVELTRALTHSLEEYQLSQARHPHSHSGHHVHYDPDGHDFEDSDVSGIGTEEDENFKKTLEESKWIHTENEEKRKLNGGAAVDGDDDLRKAIEESEKLDKEKNSAVVGEKEVGTNQKEKEDKEYQTMMGFVKKQSLLEEEHRKAVAATAAQ